MPEYHQIAPYTFPLERPTGHIVINVDGLKVILDTGSPVSIGAVDGWSFLGNPVNLKPTYLGLTLQYLSEKVGADLDILLGMDVMKDYNLVIDDRDRKVFLSHDATIPRKANNLPITRYLLGVPALGADIEGRAVNLVLDTGARFSFLSQNFLEGYQPVGQEHDFYPGYGEFDTSIYSIEMSLGEEGLITTCGVLPPPLEFALRVTGIDGILGMDVLDHFKIHLVLKENRIYFERYQNKQ